MKTFMITASAFLLSFICVSTTVNAAMVEEFMSTAHEYLQYNQVEFDSNKGVTMPVWGEDSIVQFYVQPQTGTGAEYSFSPEDLNNIEPSAGIQMKFNLDFLNF